MENNEEPKKQRGGKRAGAGRPHTGRKQTTMQLTPDERENLSVYLAALRNGDKWYTSKEMQDYYDRRMEVAVNTQKNDLSRISTSTREYYALKMFGQFIGIKSSDTKAAYTEKATKLREPLKAKLEAAQQEEMERCQQHQAERKAKQAPPADT